MRVLAFEYSVDIEALLIAGGLDINTLEIEQRWTSADCLEHVERFQPDVVLLDHYMPPNTGLEVLQSLLESTLKRPGVIVAMSSDSAKIDAMVAFGADVGIVKFELASLSLWLPHLR